LGGFFVWIAVLSHHLRRLQQKGQAMLRRLFIEHPQSVGESYAEHRAVAFSFAVQLMGAGLACAIHAVVPGLFVSTGSRAITKLSQRLAAGRRGAAAFTGYYTI
jgi:hypothetical protein